MSEQQTNGGLMRGIVVGGAIGAIAGLLLAPKRGTALREDLRMFGRDLRDRTKEWSSRLQEHASTVAGDVKDRAGSMFQTAQDKAKALADKAEDKTDEMKDRARDWVGEAKDKAQEWKSTIADKAEEELRKADNSSMAQNIDEMKKLGKEMDASKTGSELRKEGFQSDPAQ